MGVRLKADAPKLTGDLEYVVACRNLCRCVACVIPISIGLLVPTRVCFPPTDAGSGPVSVLTPAHSHPSPVPWSRIFDPKPHGSAGFGGSLHQVSACVSTAPNRGEGDWLDLERQRCQQPEGRFKVPLQQGSKKP